MRTKNETIMTLYDQTPNFELPEIPSRERQGLAAGVACAMYLAGGTAPRDFFQPLGVTAFKGGLTSRRDVLQRILDLRARSYASVIAPLEQREHTISKHPLGCEWFLSPVPDPDGDSEALALLEKIPGGAYDNGVIKFRLPHGRELPEIEKKFQSLLAPRALNRFLASEDGKRRLIGAGFPETARLFTDYDLIGNVRRSLASELFLVRPRRELGVLLAALLKAVTEAD
jgi:hypothetical protein